MADVTTGVLVRIDGREVTVPRGTTILRAARRLGIEIPTFCYHDGLSIAANCRMCLVETNKSPKLVPACHATVMDGMEVQTESPRVKDAHRGILEFILINHPVDCPICDQSGECQLQDNYRDHDLKESRLSTRKVHKPKAKPIGPNVMFDGERCILCTRCVRFTSEITKTHELTVKNRGDHSEITTFPGRELDNKYSMCAADLCPVGALTTIPFRFQARVWWLTGTDSVCDQCARGCSMRVDAYRNEIKRYVPRHNPHVNQWWMCDRGRLSFAAEATGRLGQALVREDGGAARPAPTREAAEAAIRRLREARANGTPVGLLLSPNATNESLFAALRFGRDVLKTDRVYLGGRADGDDQDDLLIRNDRNANRKGAEVIAAALGVTLRDVDALAADLAGGAVRGLVVQGSEHALPADVAAAAAKLALLVVLAPHARGLVEQAHVALPACLPTEQRGSFTNFQGRVQRLLLATEPERNTHPYGKLFGRLAAGLDAPFPWSSAAGNLEDALFAALASAVPAFAGLTIDALGEHGQPLAGEAAVTGAAGAGEA